jgi:hypothetical protein
MSQKASRGPKTVIVSIRVPQEQKDAMEKAATMAGASLSGFISDTMANAVTGVRKAAPRQSVRAAAAVPAPTVEVGRVSLSDPAVLEELRRIGININQIARAANSKLPPSVATMIETLAEILDVTRGPESVRLGLDALRRALSEPASRRSEPKTTEAATPQAEPAAQSREPQEKQKPTSNPYHYFTALHRTNRPVSWKLAGKRDTNHRF